MAFLSSYKVVMSGMIVVPMYREVVMNLCFKGCYRAIKTEIYFIFYGTETYKNTYINRARE